MLFPGKCDCEVEKPESGEDLRPKYFKSIDKVNIGAVPLRPNDGKEYGHLRGFIEKLIRESPTLEAALDRVNPQHGEILENSTQEGVADALLCGTYRQGEMEWIQKGFYNLPKSKAHEVGIYSLADASIKRMLVLLTYTNRMQKPYKIISCKEVSKEELWELRQAKGYLHEPTHPEGYYLFEVKPLVESMADVAERLKIITLDKSGVCKGVAEVAAENGIEVELVQNAETGVSAAHGSVVFDDGWTIPESLQPVIAKSRDLRKSHQTIAMNVKRKKTRKVLVRWLRILLAQVTPPRKYALYIDGRDDVELQSASAALLKDVLAAI